MTHALHLTPTRPESVARVLVAAGAVLGAASLAGAPPATAGAAFALVVAGGLVNALAAFARPPGAPTDGVWFRSNSSRGLVGWAWGAALTGLYVVLYFRPAWLAGWTDAAAPLREALTGATGDGGQWFVYSLLYTTAVVVMGARMLVRHRDSRYQTLRTLSVMAVQTVLAFLLPSLLARLQQPELYLHYTWPLDFDLFFPSGVAALRAEGRLGIVALAWFVALLVVATPVLTYLYGKRWYCSWVCGCGALAETAGDPYRHLGPTGLTAWRVERWMVHGVLALVALVTGLLWAAALTDLAWLDGVAGALSGAYGFYVGALFAGVVGVGFYPLLGSRVWCRFGCPMAAILGLQQRFFSRFRITVNGGQCISCGRCSAFCEMGIDVRHYAQRGQNVVRASCVGCGICAEVCPRGVLRLENGPDTGASRTARATLIEDLDILAD